MVSASASQRTVLPVLAAGRAAAASACVSVGCIPKLQLILCACVLCMQACCWFTPNIIIYHYQCRRNDNLITVRALARARQRTTIIAALLTYWPYSNARPSFAYILPLNYYLFDLFNSSGSSISERNQKKAVCKKERGKNCAQNVVVVVLAAGGDRPAIRRWWRID